jgi:aminoglycoside phosphotransferase family enzyme/predicted kinase
MREPRFYPHRPKDVEVVETLISTVFIADDRVYKVKKELILPFLDYGTLERRRHFCHEEVRLNRRLAPETYLGVRAIVPVESSFGLAEHDEPSAVEYAVEMRRLPEDRALDHLIESGAASAEMIRRVAQRIAEFHQQSMPAPPGRGGPSEIKAGMNDNLEAVFPWVGSALDRQTFNAVERFHDAFVLSNRELLADRVARGRVREGHGDLRAEHVVLDDGGVTIYDCVEFDEHLRFVDVASDLAFLYMDLERLGAAPLAPALERAYTEQTGDEEVCKLLPFFACYRAWIRVKVACLRLAQLDENDPRRPALLSDVQSLAALSYRFVWRARLPVVLVLCGVGASGKSTLAEEIARRSGLHHLSSDVIRKGLAGVPVEERGPSEIYEERSTMLTYDDLLVETLELLDSVGGVIVDATFGQRHHRLVLADSVRGSGARVLFCECRAPEAVLEERALARVRAPERASDATWDVIRRQIEAFEPLDEVAARDHFVVRTDRPQAETVDEIDAFASRAIEGSTVE